MNEGVEMFYHIATALVSAGAVYGGIRSDLRSMHESIREAKLAADKAHERIDRHLDKLK